MSDDSLPYHRTSGRILAALVVICIPLFLVIPDSLNSDFELRFKIGFPALCFAALWCPVLAYAGLRTRNAIDLLTGLAGTLTLFFWVPNLLLP